MRPMRIACAAVLENMRNGFSKAAGESFAALERKAIFGYTEPTLAAASLFLIFCVRAVERCV